MRQKAEERLTDNMISILRVNNEKSVTFNLMLNNYLYFSGYIGKGVAKRYILSQINGKVFTSPADDQEVEQLLKLGFRKVPASRN